MSAQSARSLDATAEPEQSKKWQIKNVAILCARWLCEGFYPGTVSIISSTPLSLSISSFHMFSLFAHALQKDAAIDI